MREYEAMILQLENEKSELSAKLSNLQREYELKMQVSKHFADINIKTESKINHLSSPVNTYNLNSPQQKITLVESQIKNVSETPGGSSIRDNQTSADRSKVSNSGFSGSYRSPSESESILSSIREGFTTTAKYGTTSLTDSNKLSAQNAQSTVYNSGYNLGVSQQGGLTGLTGLTGQSQGTYQQSSVLRSEARYEPSTYQSISQSSLQPGTAQFNQTTTSYQSSSSTSGIGAYQAGSSYQPGAYQASTSSAYQAPSYQVQSGAYQPYQASSVYGSSTSSVYKSGLNPPKPGDKK